MQRFIVKHELSKFMLYLANVALVLLVLGGIAFWWQWKVTGVEFIYSSPRDIFGFVLEHKQTLKEDILASAQRVLLPALPLGIVFGGLCGIFAATYKTLRLTLLLLLGLLWALPKLAVNIWMEEVIGSSESTIYLFNLYVAMVVGAFVAFRGALAVQSGDAQNSHDLEYAAQQFFGTRMQYFVRYLLPLCIPYLFTASYLAAGSMWPLLIFSESIVNSQLPGLGNLTFISGDQTVAMDGFYAGAFLITLCSILTWVGIRTVETIVRRVLM